MPKINSQTHPECANVIFECLKHFKHMLTDPVMLYTNICAKVCITLMYSKGLVCHGVWEDREMIGK